MAVYTFTHNKYHTLVVRKVASGYLFSQEYWKHDARLKVSEAALTEIVNELTDAELPEYTFVYTDFSSKEPLEVVATRDLIHDKNLRKEAR